VPLTPTQLDELRRFSTPTVSNAIEMFKIRKNSEGFMSPDIVCRFPDFGPMVGYAVTATFRAREESRKGTGVDMSAYYEHVLTGPAPRVIVAQDLDELPVGALFGEVQALIHKALGCVGHITNGGVRDLDECDRIGFHYFSGSILVSHAYVHLEGFGKPVNVGGTIVHPGDLIHADKHGVCLIPHSIASKVAAACKAMEALERPVIELSRSSDFTPSKLAAVRATMKEKVEKESEWFAQERSD